MMDYGLLILDYGFLIIDYGFLKVDCGLLIKGDGLLIMDYVFIAKNTFKVLKTRQDFGFSIP